MAKNSRWTIVTAIFVVLATTTPTRGQDFEVDDRVPTGDCPGCIGIPRAGVITAVNEIEIVDGASSSILHQGELFDDVSLFLDRNESQRSGDVPTELEGADYIETSQNNADWTTLNDMTIDIAIDVIKGGIVYLFIDTPEIENNGGFVPFHWMEDADEWDGNTFFDTGSSFWSPGANGGDFEPDPGDRQFYIYGVGPLDGGTYHIREQDVDSTYLSIAALFASEPGDFDNNGEVNAADIDLLGTAIRAKSDDPVFDLDGSGVADQPDLSQLVTGILNTWFGDANLDGEFNSADFVVVFQAREYEDAIEDNSSWSTGDWDADGDFTSGDFVVSFQDGGYEQGVRMPVNAVPEPTSATSVMQIILGGLIFIIFRRQHVIH